MRASPLPVAAAAMVFAAMLCVAGAPCACGQATPGAGSPSAPVEPASGYRLIQPRTPLEVSPAVLVLLQQESRFQEAVATGGGKAFSSFFADDAVLLSNGQPAVNGRQAIAAQAQWDPKEYQLTWQPEGAQMGPAGDTGLTWGHYEGRTLTTPAPGKAATASGRYITSWKKVDGAWKVAMEASANEPAQNP